jgi:thiosulfate/3-mercaptopyruvate sulfurtransferase
MSAAPAETTGAAAFRGSALEPTVPTSPSCLAALAVATFLAALPVPSAAQTPPGMLVSAAWVAAHLKDPDVVVLDAETQRGPYDEGHVPGARYLDMNGLMWQGDPPVGAEMRTPAEVDSALEAAGASDGQRIVVYGSSPLMAARAWVTLDAMGIGDHASMMDGDLAEWRREGRPISTETPAVTPGVLTLRPRSDVVVDSKWLLSRLHDPHLAILDARSEAEYAGTGGESGEGLHAGHVPGAYDLDWQRLVDSPKLPLLRPRRELDSLVDASGAPSGSTVVVYCRTGVRASFDYFVARLLGFQTKLYDGSWRDWGSKDLPYVVGTSRR